MAYGYVTNQVTIDPPSYLYDPLHMKEYTLSSDYSTSYEHLKTVMVHIDISPYVSGLLIVNPYGSIIYNSLDSCFY